MNYNTEKHYVYTYISHKFRIKTFTTKYACLTMNLRLFSIQFQSAKLRVREIPQTEPFQFFKIVRVILNAK